jgi:hypothetical protein
MTLITLLIAMAQPVRHHEQLCVLPDNRATLNRCAGR